MHAKMHQEQGTSAHFIVPGASAQHLRGMLRLLWASQPAALQGFAMRIAPPLAYTTEQECCELTGVPCHGCKVCSANMPEVEVHRHWHTSSRVARCCVRTWPDASDSNTTCAQALQALACPAHVHAAVRSSRPRSLAGASTAARGIIGVPLTLRRSGLPGRAGKEAAVLVEVRRHLKHPPCVRGRLVLLHQGRVARHIRLQAAQRVQATAQRHRAVVRTPASEGLHYSAHATGLMTGTSAVQQGPCDLA